MIDQLVGTAELEQLAELLQTPLALGEYTLEGRIARTSTALVFIARGGVFGRNVEGVLKLSGPEYAPLLERELGLLNRCRDAEIDGVVRPVESALEWISLDGVDGAPVARVAAIPLPFLSGGDLVSWIGEHATRTGRLGAHLGLQVGELVGKVLRDLLMLPRPLVHCDVKPQNVLLPYPDAPLKELTLIDFDASEELSIPLADVASAPPDVAHLLLEDVHGFGELLFELATGCEPAIDAAPDPHTGNAAFDRLVLRCLTAEAVDRDYHYVCLADNRLWMDFDAAVAAEKRRSKRPFPSGLLRLAVNQRALVGAGGVLLVALLAALAFKVVLG